jgi:catechol 2,3-dioxygenase-like lactoylglutathione lyase family enzyme
MEYSLPNELMTTMVEQEVQAMVTVRRIQHVSVPMPPGSESDEKARAFYGEALGLEEVPPPIDLAPRQLVWFRVGGPETGDELHCFADPGGQPNTPSQHLCFEVDDLEATRQRLADHGVKIESTTDIFNRPRFNIKDPFGNLIEITQIVGEYRPA